MNPTMITFTLLMALSPLLPAGAPAPRALVTCGAFTKIYDPSVGEKKKWYINDHCIFYDTTQGLWHMIGITHEEPMNPLDEDHLAHATARTLLQIPWDKKPFALDVAIDAPWHETHLWAPHVIKHKDGQGKDCYYMYYCAGDKDHGRYKIHLATSRDLKQWTRHPKNPMVVDGFDARDPFILRWRDRWLMYYTATSRPEGGNHVVACVTSRDLVNWGDRRFVFVDPAKGKWGGPTESPFVVRRGNRFYLFIGPRGGYDGTDVFVSSNPFQWSPADRAGHFPAHAAEVVRDQDGRWYMSRCGWGRGGLYLAPLTWHDGLDG